MKKVTIKRGADFAIEVDAPENFEDLMETCQTLAQTD